MLSFFPRGVLDEILNLIVSVSEGFLPSLLMDQTRQQQDIETADINCNYWIIEDLENIYHIYFRLRNTDIKSIELYIINGYMRSGETLLQNMGNNELL